MNKIDKMGISDAIDTIRKRPGMYLGSKSITALSHFLNGYQFAQQDYGVGGVERLFPLNFKFMHEFTKIQLCKDDNLGWCNHILNACDGDEEKALDKFWELYDEFKEVKMKKCWKAILSEDNIQYNDSMKYTYAMRMDGKEAIFNNPRAVYLIELTIPAFMLIVETVDGIQPVLQFFSSLEQAKGSSKIPTGAEQYFGKINLWKEVTEQNIEWADSENPKGLDIVP